MKMKMKMKTKRRETMEAKRMMAKKRKTGRAMRKKTPRWEWIIFEADAMLLQKELPQC